MPSETVKDFQALIVDDEEDICYLLKGILHHAKIEADHVTSLREADRFLKDHDPRIIFLDNHLSDGYGVNYIRQLKKSHPEAWVVMVTAYDTSADREKAYREGADFFISKPFTKNAVLDAVKYIDPK
jgi:DNA-binding response OmpR family regulator